MKVKIARGERPRAWGHHPVDAEVTKNNVTPMVEMISVGALSVFSTLEKLVLRMDDGGRADVP